MKPTSKARPMTLVRVQADACKTHPPRHSVQNRNVRHCRFCRTEPASRLVIVLAAFSPAFSLSVSYRSRGCHPIGGCCEISGVA